MSPRTGRPKSDNPMGNTMGVRLDKETEETMKECANVLKVSNSEVVRRGIWLVKSQIEKK